MLELRASKWKMLLLLAGCAAFVSIGLVMAYDPSPRRSGQHFWGWLNVGFFGLGVAVALRELVRGSPRLVISDAGIDDRANGLGVIPWSEIAGAEVKMIRRNAILSLRMHDPEPWVARLPARYRWLSFATRARGFSEINVALAGLTRSPAEVFEEVRRHLGAAAV